MKIRPVGARLYHADSETDRPRDRHDERNSRFFFAVLQTCLKQWVTWLVAEGRGSRELTDDSINGPQAMEGTNGNDSNEKKILF